MREIIKQRINDSIEVKKGLLENESLLENLECLTHEIKKAIRKGHKLVLCGNGGLLLTHFISLEKL